jgi:hypothetical protein
VRVLQLGPNQIQSTTPTNGKTRTIATQSSLFFGSASLRNVRVIAHKSANRINTPAVISILALQDHSSTQSALQKSEDIAGLIKPTHIALLVLDTQARYLFFSATGD